MRLADNDQLTARFQLKRAGEAMPECRPPLSPSTLRADLPDQGALHGLLQRIAGLRLELIDVHVVAPLAE